MSQPVAIPHITASLRELSDTKVQEWDYEPGCRRSATPGEKLAWRIGTKLYHAPREVTAAVGQDLNTTPNRIAITFTSPNRTVHALFESVDEADHFVDGFFSGLEFLSELEVSA